MDLQKCDAKMYFCKCFLFIVFFFKKKNTKKHRIFASNFCKGGLCFLSNKKRAFAKIHFCITFLQSNKNKSQKMMINLIERDFSRRRQACKYELSRLTLKSIIENRNIGEQERWRAITKLRDLPRNSSRTRLRNRCVFTGRGRSVYRFCKLSRIELRRLAGAGKLPGVTKSSW